MNRDKQWTESKLSHKCKIGAIIISWFLLHFDFIAWALFKLWVGTSMSHKLWKLAMN